MGFINALPQELFLHIASLLNVQDVYRLRQVLCLVDCSTVMPAPMLASL
jgi:hypothetical protein